MAGGRLSRVFFFSGGVDLVSGGAAAPIGLGFGVYLVPDESNFSFCYARFSIVILGESGELR